MRLHLTLGAAVLAAALLPCSVAGAAIVSVSTHGSSGSGPGQVNGPGNVAIVPDTGEFVVADTQNWRLSRFAADGSPIGTIGSGGPAGPGQFSQPVGVAVDPADGSIYASDAIHDYVQKFRRTASGYVYERTISGIDGPLGLAVHPDTGTLYVAAAAEDRVRRYDADGTPLSDLTGGSGTGNGQLDYPSAVAVDATADVVYVSDFANDRIQRFTSAGAYLGQFAFASPFSLAIDPSTRDVYTATLESMPGFYGQVDRLTPTGTPVTSFGTVGTGAMQLDGPAGLAIDCNGTILVGDRYNDRVSRWRDDAVPAVCPAPAVTTGGADDVRADRATVAGTVDPQGLSTSYVVEYGTTSSLGRASGVAQIPGGRQASQAVEVTLTGLEPGTTVQYRLVATNRSGTTRGAVRTLQTADAPPTMVSTTTTTTTTTTTPVASVTSARVTPRRVTVSARSTRDRRFPYRYRLRGRVVLPAGADARALCRGRVTVQIKRGKITLSTRRASLTRTCSWSRRLSFAQRGRLARRGGALRVLVRFAGSETLAPVARQATMTLRYGRRR